MTRSVTRRSLSLGLAAAPWLARAARAQPVGAAAPSADARLLAYLDACFDAQAALSPETLTNLGLKTDYGRLDDYTDAAASRALALQEQQLKQLQAGFRPAELSPSAQLSVQLFARNVATARENYRWRWHEFPISTNGTPAGEIPVFLINEHRIDSVADAQAYVSRLRDVERVMHEIAANVRQQAQMGIVPPKMVFAPARRDAEAVLKGAPFTAGPDCSLRADFRKKLGALKVSDAEKARLTADADAALTGPFKRGYDVFFAVLDELEPKAVSNDGAWRLPDGAAYYQSRLRYYTTTDLTAEQIHQIGLQHVASIQAEMAQVKAQVGFQGSLQAFFTEVRTDPRLKYADSQQGREQYLADARAAIAQTMAAAPRFFRRLPKAPLEVRAVEPWRQDTAAVAFYDEPAMDGSRPGIFYVNLADMTQVQKPQVEGIAHHEGAPGHHFQIARSQELADMPKFRKRSYYGAYTEGWGLYSERLAGEMGAYQDPYARFGMLSLQVWRAIRLVTDTGLHAKRWSREQAVAFFRENSSLSDHDIGKEVDRYINNPGQATSYMVGQLKISGLREKAQTALGPKFDIRDFHEVVIASGALPLDVLENQVGAYIAGTWRA